MHCMKITKKYFLKKITQILNGFPLKLSNFLSDFFMKLTKNIKRTVFKTSGSESWALTQGDRLRGEMQHGSLSFTVYSSAIFYTSNENFFCNYFSYDLWYLLSSNYRENQSTRIISFSLSQTLSLFWFVESDLQKCSLDYVTLMAPEF